MARKVNINVQVNKFFFNTAEGTYVSPDVLFDEHFMFNCLYGHL